MIADFKKKKNRNSLKQFLLISGGILFLFLYVLLVVANVRIYKKRTELISQIENLKNKVQDIKSKNNNLKENILKTNDDEYIEKVAREELDLQKPGEKVFSFIMPQNQQQDTNIKKDNWSAWISNAWQWIKSNF